MGKDF